MSFLVITHKHELTPFAYRLKNQGNQTELVVCLESFEKTWKGKFDRILPAKEMKRKGDPTEHLGPALDLARKGEVIVISNNLETSKMFQDVETFYGVLQVKEYPAPKSLLRLGGWWAHGKLHMPHILIADIGVWPGGYGPALPGGMTLVRVGGESEKAFHEFIEPISHLLASRPFQGLFQVGVVENAAGTGFEIEGLELGWPFLQSHAFLSELSSFATLLKTGTAELPKKVVSVVPVSIPPWPSGSRRKQSREGEEVKGLTEKQAAQVFWHDVRLDLDKRTIHSGGTDGLLGVCRGAGESHHLARQRALQLGLSIQVPEKQVRPDAGALVPEVLAQLEVRLGLVL